MNKVIYCKYWSRNERLPIQVWNLEKARKAHEDRSLYTVVIGDNEHPKCFIELAKGFAVVSFLDNFFREYLVYQFKEVETNKLFLVMALHRDYVDDTPELLKATTYNFSQDGLINIRKRCFNTDNLEVSSIKSEVFSNYENYPEFGDYDSISKPERIR